MPKNYENIQSFHVNDLKNENEHNKNLYKQNISIELIYKKNTLNFQVNFKTKHFAIIHKIPLNLNCGYKKRNGQLK